MSTLTSELSSRGAGSALLTSLTAVWRTYRKFSTRRGAIRDLESLDDYILRDMGITRSVVRSVMNRPRQEQGQSYDDFKG
jgi:uncharacterized protein YjiS (DUF1127 family)